MYALGFFAAIASLAAASSFSSFANSSGWFLLTCRLRLPNLDPKKKYFLKHFSITLKLLNLKFEN